jgi:membrane fusion protein
MASKAGARRIAHALRFHKDGIDAARSQGRTIAMTQPLFRPEVLEAKRGSWLGGISLAQPVRLWVLTLAAVVVASAIVLFVTWGTYTRRSTVTGQLVPSQGLATVLAPATGVVTRLDASEGGRVEAGEVLAVITVPRVTLASGDMQVALEQQLGQRQAGLVSAQHAQRSQLLAQMQGAGAQLSVAQRELAQIESEVATRRDQIRIANETLERLRRLEGGHYVSVLQIKQQEAAVLEYTGQMQALQRQAIGTRRLIAQLQQTVRELPAQGQATEAGFQRELAQLEQERVQTQASGALVVKAPVTGVVATQVTAIDDLVAGRWAARSRVVGAESGHRFHRAGRPRAAALSGVSVPEVRSPGGACRGDQSQRVEPR